MGEVGDFSPEIEEQALRANPQIDEELRHLETGTPEASTPVDNTSTLQEKKEAHEQIYSKLMDSMDESADKLGGFYFAKIDRKIEDNDQPIEDPRVYLLTHVDDIPERDVVDRRSKRMIYLTSYGAFEATLDPSWVEALLPRIDDKTGTIKEGGAEFKCHYNKLMLNDHDIRRWNGDMSLGIRSDELKSTITQSIEDEKQNVEERRKHEEQLRQWDKEREEKAYGARQAEIDRLDLDLQGADSLTSLIGDVTSGGTSNV